MFCSGCGTELDAGLNFCKRCGSRVGGDDRAVVAAKLSSSLGYIGGCGLLGFIAVLFLLLRSPTITGGTIALVTVLYLGTLLATSYLILRQTAPFARGPGGGQRSDVPAPPPAYSKPVTTARLNEPADTPISVTEQTTRELDYSEQNRER